MSLKFRDEAERQKVVRLHAEIYRRARRGEISIAKMLRLSRALIAPYQKGPKPTPSGTTAAQKEQE